jgi:hypothetical protein
MWYNKELKLKSVRPRVKGRPTKNRDKLLAHGWLPLLDNLPSYNPETQRLVRMGVDVEDHRAVQKYAVEPITAEADRVDRLRDYVHENMISLNNLISTSEGRSMRRIWSVEDRIEFLEGRVAELESEGGFIRWLKKLIKLIRR